MITGINIAYDQPETRSSWRVQTLALVFTFGFVVFGIVSLALIAFFPWMFERLAGQVGIGPLGQMLASTARWVLLLAAVVTAVALAYRFAPNHREPCWRCVRWGAAVASLLWLVASMGFSWYAASFGSFNETYGSLAGIVVLLLWLDISAYVVLFGAEVSSELEQQLGQPNATG
jgi:membrane protein